MFGEIISVFICWKETKKSCCSNEFEKCKAVALESWSFPISSYTHWDQKPTEMINKKSASLEFPRGWSVYPIGEATTSSDDLGSELQRSDLSAGQASIKEFTQGSGGNDSDLSIRLRINLGAFTLGELFHSTRPCFRSSYSSTYWEDLTGSGLLSLADQNKEHVYGCQSCD